jgi:beta-glucosidase
MTAGPANPKASASPKASVSTETMEEGDRIAALSLEDKVRLLTGADSWRTHGAGRLGLRPMITSDGPAGVRGITLDDRNPSASFPCPSALGATWDSELVLELATALGTEARSKGVDILLAPTINLMRTPLGGRGFECFSEDPVLTARIAVAYVQGVQSAGVAATVKHYVGNDSETQRWSYDARIAEHVLRELYLVPFEACVREADTGLVMAAYNAVNGSRMTEHAVLLRDVLKGEWGFTGVVVSDWEAARSTVPAATAGLDLAMPGPGSPWGEALVRAVREGAVAEKMIDDKVLRLMRVARRLGAVGQPAATAPARPGRDGAVPAGMSPDGVSPDGVSPDGAGLAGTSPDGTSPDGAGLAGASPAGDRTPAPSGSLRADPRLLRRAAAASFVLLRNVRDALPVDPGGISRVALIGPNAAHPVIQGGGSAGVIPVTVSTPAGALAHALAGRASVTMTPGCQTWATVPQPAAGSVCDPVTGERGVRLEFRSADGTLLAAEHRNSTLSAWWGEGLPPGVGWGESGTISLLTSFRADTAGPHAIGAAGVGRLTLTVDGAVIADGETPVPADPVETMTRPGEVRSTITLAAGQEAVVRLDFRPGAGAEGPLAIRLGIVAAPDEEAMLDEAVHAAGAADVAVVVVGSAETTESEGFDRQTLALPGRQDELVQRVSAVNARTVVVVNSGMPVLMPWADQAAAVIYAWLPGQAMGEALADVLLGQAEPGGRLPVTIPADEADCPVLHAVPRDGQLGYHEGLLIGYRGYDAAGTTPQFPFGHGLGYTSWAYESLSADLADLPAGEDLGLRVSVRNAGPRPGREVVQVYVAGPRHGPGRPVRVLGAFGSAAAAPGETVEVALRVPARVFAVYDAKAGGWTWPRGAFTIEVGRSSRDLRLSAAVMSG